MTYVLECRDLESGYGRIQVLWGVSLGVPRDSIVALLGPNGAGKTTTLRTIMGLVRPWRGSVKIYGVETSDMPPHKKVRMGLALVPEGRRLFPEMTVRENLLVGAYTSGSREKIREALEVVYSLFPRLRERLDQRAGTLSGGEQQMLAIARALMSMPKILMLDEPSQGLAPKVAWEVAETLDKIRREVGVSVLLVEQNIALALEKSEYIYVMEQGRVVVEGDREEILRKRLDVLKAYLGV